MQFCFKCSFVLLNRYFWIFLLENKSKIHNSPISVNHYAIFSRNAPFMFIKKRKKKKKLRKKDKTMETFITGLHDYRPFRTPHYPPLQDNTSQHCIDLPPENQWIIHENIDTLIIFFPLKQTHHIQGQTLQKQESKELHYENANDPGHQRVKPSPPQMGPAESPPNAR